MNARFLAHWLTTAAALGVTAWILPGVRVDSFAALAVSALVLGFVNAIVRPVLVLLTLPFTVLTLGLFYVIVNGVAFGLAAFLVPGFSVASFFTAVQAAFVVGVISWFIGIFSGRRGKTAARSAVVDVHRHHDGRWGT
ncbi:MAG: phage holin family protein [Acidobacteria bacterium]|nr:MAG: phage holin family protein [Acidobacteriota bacterium]